MNSSIASGASYSSLAVESLLSFNLNALLEDGTSLSSVSDEISDTTGLDDSSISSCQT
ncbi:uncharacterized protein BX663DRAFT_555720 [Cokeromyces recurvatus]|uniref:uncharacterized protein n=1 Tax=Cokeromyces recurvatus TaxID=90255 RepID=UPI002220D85B|nr:uncharacterized protein BX663DRAFT_555720 [Cokeromyces recurvatus]KAI7898508.1 hypothetical protein BX663DRAFT_555720 [Cokeromyces recurvatus]